MTVDQIAILALLGVMLAVFATDRVRIEVVALAGLAVAVAAGLVAPERAFSGFSSSAVVTVVEILLIVGVVARSPVFARLAAAATRRAPSPTAAIAGLLACAALLSSVMNNIGALALMLPVALSVSATLAIPRGRVVMLLSFATLLGGLCTSLGTPANLVVSEAAREATGGPSACWSSPGSACR